MGLFQTCHKMVKAVMIVSLFLLALFITPSVFADLTISDNQRAQYIEKMSEPGGPLEHVYPKTRKKIIKNLTLYDQPDLFEQILNLNSRDYRNRLNEIANINCSFRFGQNKLKCVKDKLGKINKSLTIENLKSKHLRTYLGPKPIKYKQKLSYKRKLSKTEKRILEKRNKQFNSMTDKLTPKDLSLISQFQTHADETNFYRNLSQLDSTQQDAALKELRTTVRRACTDPVRCIQELEKLHIDVAQKAYQINKTETLKAVAKEFKIPIIVRESTAISQAAQQNNMAAKPSALQNKSSTIDGNIPTKGIFGKKGDEYRKLGCPYSLNPRCDEMKKGLDVEDKLAKSLMEHHPEEYKEATKSRVTKAGVKEIFVYDPEPVLRDLEKEVKGNLNRNADNGFRWVPEKEYEKENLRRIKANLENIGKIPPVASIPTLERYTYFVNQQGVPYAADTDVVLYGVPEGSSEHLVHDLDYGYRINEVSKVQMLGNHRWKQFSGSETAIFQHGDEVNFGLSGLRGEKLTLVGLDGMVETIDVPARQAHEAAGELSKASKSALRRVGYLLGEQIKMGARIILPDKDVLMERKNYLEKAKGVILDIDGPLAEFDTIKAGMKDYFKENPTVGVNPDQPWVKAQIEPDIEFHSLEDIQKSHGSPQSDTSSEIVFDDSILDESSETPSKDQPELSSMEETEPKSSRLSSSLETDSVTSIVDESHTSPSLEIDDITIDSERTTTLPEVSDPRLSATSTLGDPSIYRNFESANLASIRNNPNYPQFVRDFIAGCRASPALLDCQNFLRTNPSLNTFPEAQALESPFLMNLFRTKKETSELIQRKNLEKAGHLH